jgi:hypothetical protein
MRCGSSPHARLRPPLAGDNAGPHGRFFKLSGNLRGGGRETGRSIGHELLESDEHDAIFSLGAFRRKGASCETAATTDPTHDAKNGSLQPYHLACFLQLGNYALLAMMFVAVRAAAGLHASDVNNADPMDVPAAERRLNVATRRELAKRPECFGLLVYLWAIASARAAFLDRAPSTTPRTRVRWALRCLVFLRWWLDWIEVTASPSTSFISMETHAAHVIQCQMLVMIVLLWGRDFSDKEFAPWLIGSDQNEHFFSELRAYRRGSSDFTLAECMRIVQRYISSLELFNREGVQLPPVFSNKGYSRSTWTPSPSNEYLFNDWPSAAEIRTIYLEEVEVVRPLMVALGCATALRSAGRWHMPSLEEWKAIEAALDQEEQQQARRGAPRAARRRRPADESDESDENDESDKGSGGSSDGDGGQEEELDDEVGGEAEEEEHFPERILDHRLGKGAASVRVAGREFKIQWRGYGTGTQDVTWEKQSELIEDGNALLVHRYLQANPTLKRPDGLDAAVQAAGEASSGEGGGSSEVGGSGNSGDDPAPPEQPAILPVNMAVLLLLLTAPLGAETPNGTGLGAQLKQGASAAQRRAYEATRIENPETGQMVHKSAALAFVQRQALDATPGAGRGRYVRSTHQPVIAEDRDGSGFACHEYYELHVNTKGAGLNSGSGELLLEGLLNIGYARVMELRKLNGKGRVLRHSIRATDASVTLAVLQPLVKRGDSWAIDFALAPPVLVPVLSLGRRMEAASAAGGTLTVTAAAAAAGGLALRRMVLSEELFHAGAMQVVKKNLLDQKVLELKEELTARGEGTTGNKAFLLRRLHAAIVRLNMDSEDRLG